MNNFENTYTNGLSFNKFLTKSFMVMFIGLLITGVVAFVSFPFLMTIISKLGFLSVILLCVLQFGLTFYFNSRLSTVSKASAYACFFLYSAITGLTFSSITYVYDGKTIALAFFMTAVMFGCMAIIGNRADVDFTKFGPYLVSGLIAILLMTLINGLFFHSSGLDLLIDYAVIIIFLVMIAYDMQRLRSIYVSTSYDSELSDKFAIYGAFTIYLDFINIFVRILSILGRRNDD